MPELSRYWRATLMTLTWITRRRAVGPDGVMYWACEECGGGFFNEDDKQRHERWHEMYGRLLDSVLKIAKHVESHALAINDLRQGPS
jgi:hypothetical protein